MNYFFLFSHPVLPCRVKMEVPVWRITSMTPLNAIVTKDLLVNIVKKVDCQYLELCSISLHYIKGAAFVLSLFVICANLFHPQPSLFLYGLLLSLRGFLQFKGNSVDGLKLLKIPWLSCFYDSVLKQYDSGTLIFLQKRLNNLFRLPVSIWSNQSSQKKNISERTWINQPRSMFSKGFQAIATIDKRIVYIRRVLSERFSAIVACICLISGKWTVKHQSL